MKERERLDRHNVKIACLFLVCLWEKLNADHCLPKTPLFSVFQEFKSL